MANMVIIATSNRFFSPFVLSVYGILVKEVLVITKNVS